MIAYMTRELPYRFENVDRLVDDFLQEVEKWKNAR
jgi:hypothetical protein